MENHALTDFVQADRDDRGSSGAVLRRNMPPGHIQPAKRKKELAKREGDESGKKMRESPSIRSIRHNGERYGKRRVTGGRRG